MAGKDIVSLLLLAVVQQYNVAYNPRAGVWTPASLSGLQAWWQGDSCTDGADFSCTDLSGNGYSLDETTDSLEPAISSAYLNGHDAVDCDGVDDIAATSAWTDIEQPNVTWAVFEYDDYTGNWNYIHDGNDLTDRNILGIGNWTGELGQYAGGWVRDGTAFDNDPHYAVALYDGASSYVRVDAVEVMSGTPSTQGLGGITMCNSQEAAGDADVKILEMGVIDGGISAGDRTSLEAYLADRYGL